MVESAWKPPVAATKVEWFREVKVRCFVATRHTFFVIEPNVLVMSTETPWEIFWNVGVIFLTVEFQNLVHFYSISTGTF